MIAWSHLLSYPIIRSTLWLYGGAAALPIVLGIIARLFTKRDPDDARLHPGYDVELLRAKQEGPVTPEPQSTALEPWPEYPASRLSS
jgi:hypothetical protein